MRIRIKAGQPKSKYHNKKVVIEGITFASIKEGRRYIFLKKLEAAKEISLLRLQVPFYIKVNGEKVCRYVADFVYFDKAGKRIVEDCKGFKTDIYKLKKKLLAATAGINITET